MSSSTSAKRRRQSLAVFATLLIIGLLICIPILASRKNRARYLSGTDYQALLPYVLAMAKHESADFKSNVYKTNNNPFGMKVAKVRPFLGSRGTPAPDGGDYAYYPDEITAWLDLVEWFKYTKFPRQVLSVEEFARQLKDRSYYGDTINNYINGMKRFL